MTLTRRLSTVEESLSSTQLVLAWLTGAHSFGSVAAYVASLVESDPPVAPLDRLARAAARSARKLATGQRRDIAEASVRSAVREAVFRYELVVRVNAVALQTLQRETLMAASLAAQVALATNQTKRASSTSQDLGHTLGLLAAQGHELQAVAEARTIVEERYLDGHGTLFPDVAAAWQTQVARNLAISGLVNGLHSPDRTDASRQPDASALTRPQVELLADLVEPARAAATAKAGDGGRGLGIASGWLATKLLGRVEEDVANDGPDT